MITAVELGNNRNLWSVHDNLGAPRPIIVVGKMTKLPGTTRIAVRRIVIEVNRDLTVEQFEILDETLKKLGLVKETKVSLRDEQPHKPRVPRLPKPLVMPTVLPSQPPDSKPAQAASS